MSSVPDQNPGSDNNILSNSTTKVTANQYLDSNVFAAPQPTASSVATGAPNEQTSLALGYYHQSSQNSQQPPVNYNDHGFSQRATLQMVPQQQNLNVQQLSQPPQQLQQSSVQFQPLVVQQHYYAPPPTNTADTFYQQSPHDLSSYAYAPSAVQIMSSTQAVAQPYLVATQHYDAFQQSQQASTSQPQAQSQLAQSSQSSQSSQSQLLQSLQQQQPQQLQLQKMAQPSPLLPNNPTYQAPAQGSYQQSNYMPLLLVPTQKRQISTPNVLGSSVSSIAGDQSAVGSAIEQMNYMNSSLPPLAPYGNIYSGNFQQGPSQRYPTSQSGQQPVLSLASGQMSALAPPYVKMDYDFGGSSGSSFSGMANVDGSVSSASTSVYDMLKKGRRKSSKSSHIMTPETAERNRCRICNKQFKRPSSLQTHYYSHTGEKIFKCPWPGCGRLFSVKSNMTRHYRLHERDFNKSNGKELDPSSLPRDLELYPSKISSSTDNPTTTHNNNNILEGSYNYQQPNIKKQISE